ncbi:purine nucleoside phosphorylase-like [Danio aesculapii]|uniref:purine nucleoside phosphorylase-like n=1 Tax=Danio aesculapii TaxID=1142201 RepID=UPI0024BF5636|nr:purine nucleoside phosphorylase-like [Danio aesculapii]
MSVTNMIFRKNEEHVEGLNSVVLTQEQGGGKVQFEDCQATADWLLSQTAVRPLVGIVCGSGLGGLADALKDQVLQLPGHSQLSSEYSSRSGRLVFGTLKGRPCVCMQGRFHLYEGYPIQKITMPMRIFKMLGVETVILTNAAGGLNQDYKVGDIMIIKDHLNMPGFAGGNNPLAGHNDESVVDLKPVTNYISDIVAQEEQIYCTGP